MMFGTALYNHPVDDEHLPRRHAIRQMLVPSDWVKAMFSKVWPDIVSVWPVGIDTDRWAPSVGESRKTVDVLVYEKLFRDGDRHRVELVEPMMADLRRRGLGLVSALRLLPRARAVRAEPDRALDDLSQPARDAGHRRRADVVGQRAGDGVGSRRRLAEPRLSSCAACASAR